MKKALLFFLISGFAFAQDVTYSLEEMFTKIVDSKTLSPSGKVFLMGYFEDLDPIEMDLNDLSKQLCENASLEDIQLFSSDAGACQRNLILFLTHFEKEFELTGSVDIGPDGKLRGANIGIVIRTK
jgi:hypothetical protein